MTAQNCTNKFPKFVPPDHGYFTPKYEIESRRIVQPAPGYFIEQDGAYNRGEIFRLERRLNLTLSA